MTLMIQLSSWAAKLFWPLKNPVCQSGEKNCLPGCLEMRSGLHLTLTSHRRELSKSVPKLNYKCICFEFKNLENDRPFKASHTKTYVIKSHLFVSKLTLSLGGLLLLVLLLKVQTLPYELSRKKRSDIPKPS